MDLKKKSKKTSGTTTYMDEILAYLDKHSKDTGIIYVLTREEAEKTNEILREHGIQSAFYHAGLTGSQRILVHQRWCENEVRVLCATIAYGMGIDKENVRFVIHTCLAKSIEGYYQESGRVDMFLVIHI